MGVRAEGLGPGRWRRRDSTVRARKAPAPGPGRVLPSAPGAAGGPRSPPGLSSAWPVVLARFLRLATRPLVGQDGAF